MSAVELLSQYRALGGVADNVQLRQGPHGWGLFVVDPGQPVRVFTPAHLLIAPQDLRLTRQGHVQVRPQAGLSPDLVCFHEAYQRELGWGAAGLARSVRQQLRPIALSTISTRLGTSLSYLEQLFSALRRAGLVDSTRGPGGGYTLARNTDQISVAEIILAVENLKTDDLQSLGAGQAAQVKSMTGELWSTFNARVMEYLQSVTLQDLVAQQHAKGVVAEEMANAKQTVEAEAKTQQSTIKKQKNGAKTTAEVVWRLSAEDGNAVMVAVAAKATAEDDGVTGRRGGKGDCSNSRHGVQR